MIIPIFNVEKYLDSCLNSVISQIYSNIEILLIDDGSTDKSGRIVDEYAEKDRRIRAFHTENGGVCRARNIGLDKMMGKYCILLDSDDVLRKDAIEQAVMLLEKEKLDCVVYKYMAIDDENINNYMQTKAYGEPIENCGYYQMSHNEVMREILIGQRFRMLACNKLYPASLWNNIRFPMG